jgi:hypothetical protein
MNNGLRWVGCDSHTLSPTEAEIWITAGTEHLTATTEIRGHLVGPHCLYATTVEVAYPIRPIPHPPENLPPLTRRVIIPEPSLWDPQSPFVYRAVVELWQDGSRRDRAEFDFGLRARAVTSRGLTWNGKGLTVQGSTCLPKTQEVSQFRQAGYNLLLTDLEGNSIWWTAANRLGFLMLGRLPPTVSALSLAVTMGAQVSSFGWLLWPGLLDNELQAGEYLAQMQRRGDLIGVELEEAPVTPLPDWLSFVACPEEALSAVASVALPKLITRLTSKGNGKPKPAALPPGVLGWIDT